MLDTVEQLLHNYGSSLCIQADKDLFSKQSVNIPQLQFRVPMLGSTRSIQKLLLKGCTVQHNSTSFWILENILSLTRLFSSQDSSGAALETTRATTMTFEYILGYFRETTVHGFKSASLETKSY